MIRFGLEEKPRTVTTRFHHLSKLLVEYIQERLYCPEPKRMNLWKEQFPAFEP